MLHFHPKALSWFATLANSPLIKTLALQFWHILVVLVCWVTITSLFNYWTLILVDRVIDEVGAKTREHLYILFPVLLTFLKDNNPIVVKQSIISGTKIFRIVLEELALQVSLSSLSVSLSACELVHVCVRTCSYGWQLYVCAFVYFTYHGCLPVSLWYLNMENISLNSVCDFLLQFLWYLCVPQVLCSGLVTMLSLYDT